MARLLSKALARGTEPAYIRRLLAAFPVAEPEHALSAPASSPDSEWVEPLSAREREVLQLIAEGRSSKEVAEVLSISPATVETHRTHILQKLDVHNTAELVLYAVRRGVVS